MAFATLVLFAAARAEEEAATDSGYSSEYSTAGEGTGANGGSSEGAAGKSSKTPSKELEQYKYREYDNCYELLGVNPESGPIPIKRAYRRLAAEYHPDKCLSGDIEMCREVFPKYANAHEVLSTRRCVRTTTTCSPTRTSSPALPGGTAPEVRAQVRPALRAPDDGPRLRGRAVLHQEDHLRAGPGADQKGPARTVPGAAQGGDGPSGNSSPSKLGSAKNKGGPKGEDLEKRKKEAMAILDAELASELLPPPSVADNIAVDLFKLPLTLTYTALWVLKGGMREPAYMTRKALGMSAAEWGDLADEEQEELVGQELWVADKLAAYQEEERRAARAGRAVGEAEARGAAAQAREAQPERAGHRGLSGGRGWGAVARKWTWTCAQSHAVSSLASTTSACPNMDQAQV